MGYFPVRYNSRVIIYERKMFIRLVTVVVLPLILTSYFMSQISKGKEENTNLLCKGKYHCSADLIIQSNLLGFGWFAYEEGTTDLLVCSNPNQSNRRRSAALYGQSIKPSWMTSASSSRSSRAQPIVAWFLPRSVIQTQSPKNTNDYKTRFHNSWESFSQKILTSRR